VSLSFTCNDAPFVPPFNRALNTKPHLERLARFDSDQEGPQEVGQVVQLRSKSRQTDTITFKPRE
jgi:hypothetical protein